MTRLHELAKAFGVETHDGPMIEYQDGTRKYIGPRTLRPALDIAHDVLAKLPETSQWTINHIGGQHWSWFWTMAETGTGTFEEAVTALAERAREGRGNDA